MTDTRRCSNAELTTHLRLAEDGIVGQYKGSQARETLLTLEQWEVLKARRDQARDDTEEEAEEAEEAYLSDEEADMET